MYEILESMDEVERIHLANPYKVCAIVEAKIKTDTIDTHTLAHLPRFGLIPAVHVPSKETRRAKVRGTLIVRYEITSVPS